MIRRPFVDHLFQQVRAQQPERLQHIGILIVCDGENRRPDAQREIVGQTPRDPFGLAVLAPLVVAQRVGPFEDRRAAALAREEADARIVGGDQFGQRLDAGRGVVGIFVIGMEAHIVDEVQFAALADDVQHPARESERHARKAEADDDRLGIDLADGFGRADQQFGIGRGLVGAPKVRLVPHLPLADAALVTARHGRHIAFPGPQRLLVGEYARSQALLGPVHRISVGEAHPRTDALFAESVNRLVEPPEFVFPLFLLAAGPAALDARGAHAQLAHIRLVSRKIGIFAVEALASHRPARVGQLARRGSRQRTDLFESGRNRLHLFPGQRPMLCRGGRGEQKTGEAEKESFFH